MYFTIYNHGFFLMYRVRCLFSPLVGLLGLLACRLRGSNTSCSIHPIDRVNTLSCIIPPLQGYVVCGNTSNRQGLHPIRIVSPLRGSAINRTISQMWITVWKSRVKHVEKTLTTRQLYTYGQGGKSGVGKSTGLQNGFQRRFQRIWTAVVCYVNSGLSRCERDRFITWYAADCPCYPRLHTALLFFFICFLIKI